jgi:hypothetical protein
MGNAIQADDADTILEFSFLGGHGRAIIIAPPARKSILEGETPS